MKNLKKVLAFALVVCMMLSTIVSATAISATDYTDYSTIKNADQVAVLTELGVINGYPDESFKPEKTVSRAEMAKMITVILNKGTEAAGNYDGAQVFSDVYADMWCKGYINYCNTLGIVVGMGDGTYKPNQGVTVVQTAKMLLVAMGYDPVVEGFEGANWEVNVSAIAAQAGLYNGVTANAAAECSRDTAALIIYNALVANTVDGYTNGKAVVGDKTMLGKYFNAVVVTGVVVANDYANLFGSSALYNAKHASTELALIGTQYVDDDDPIDPGINFLVKNAAENYNYTYDDSFPISFTKNYVKEYGNNDFYNSQIFETATSLPQVGQTVKVVAVLKDNYDFYYKNAIGYPDFTFSGKVIGNAMDVDCVAKVYDGVYDVFDAKELKKEGITLDANTRYFMNYSVMWTQFGVPSRYTFEDDYDYLGFYNASITCKLDDDYYINANANEGIFFNADGVVTKLIDVDGDGVIEIVLQWRPFFAKIEYSTYFKTYCFDYSSELGGMDGFYAGYDYSDVDPDDIICDTDLKDGDCVLVVPVDGKYYVEVCETKDVIVDTVSLDAEKKDYIKDTDGTTYYESGIYWAEETYDLGKDGPDHNELYWNLSECEVDTEYTLYFDSYGNVVAYKEVKGPPSSAKYALVTASERYYNGTTKEDVYTLELTKGGETSQKYVPVQWEGTRARSIDPDAEPFFANGIPDATLRFLPFNSAYNDVFQNLIDYNTGTTTNYINFKIDELEQLGLVSSWNLSLSSSPIYNENAFFVDYPGSLFATAIYQRYFNDFAALGVWDEYSYGHFTALIRTGYNDDNEVDVKELKDIQSFLRKETNNTIAVAENRSVDARQNVFKGTDGTKYYADDDTVFFIYQYDEAGNVVDVYSFTGYTNLPAIAYNWYCNCDFAGCECDEEGVVCDVCAAGSCECSDGKWQWATGYPEICSDVTDCECDTAAVIDAVSGEVTPCDYCVAAGHICPNTLDAAKEYVGAEHADKWYATGISAMYGEVEKGGKDALRLNALVIETNAKFIKTISEYYFVYNVIKKSTLDGDSVYQVEYIDNNGELGTMWVDGITSHSGNIFSVAGSNYTVNYGTYSRTTCLTDQKISGESGVTLYDLKLVTNSSSLKTTVLEGTPAYSAKYLEFGDGNVYKTSSTTSYYFRCSVLYNSTNVHNFMLAETDRDTMFPDRPDKYYTNSFMVIWKPASDSNGSYREVLAVIGSYASPMVYDSGMGQFVSADASVNKATYMKSDASQANSNPTPSKKNTTSFEYFQSIVAPKAGGPPAGEVAPVNP